MKTTYKDFTVNIRKIDEGGMEADFYLPKYGKGNWNKRNENEIV